MSLTSVSLVTVNAESESGGGTASPAGDPTYVLNASELEKTDKGALADSQKIFAGEGDYFTLYGSTKMAINEKSKIP